MGFSTPRKPWCHLQQSFSWTSSALPVHYKEARGLLQSCSKVDKSRDAVLVSSLGRLFQQAYCHKVGSELIKDTLPISYSRTSDNVVSIPYCIPLFIIALASSQFGALNTLSMAVALEAVVRRLKRRCCVGHLCDTAQDNGTQRLYK